MTVTKRKTKRSNITADQKTSEKTPPRDEVKQRLHTFQSLIRRAACAILIVGVIYYSQYMKQTEKVFARWDDVARRRSFGVKCSPDYDVENKTLQACIPKICGRVVTDTLITPEEVQHLLSIAKKGLAKGGSSGGASILDLHSGALSQGEEFINVYKLPGGDKLFTEEDFAVYRNIKNKIHYMMGMEFGAQLSDLHLTHPTFFSHMTNKPAKTTHDEYWHPHIDKETYKSFHYTSLVYLTTYTQDFDGGRFVFVDKDANVTVEPRKGRVSMFTSGSENLHYVEKVTRGERYALTVSFTCNKKYALDNVAGRKM